VKYCAKPIGEEFCGQELGHAGNCVPYVPPPPLYAVTTIAQRGAGYGGTRLVAICLTEERAREIIENNEGDIFETSYTWAVIEKVTPDTLYGGLEHFGSAKWYEWEGTCDDGKYVPLAGPTEKFHHIVGWWEAGPKWHDIVEKAFTGPFDRDTAKKLKVDAENVLTWETPKDGDILMFAHLRRFADATLKLLKR
jgi:hypothetical protein